MPAGWPSRARPAPAGPPPAGPFAAGFRSAIAREVAALRGEPVEEESYPHCAACGEAFDPVVSRDPHFCGPCAEEGAYK